jgi:arginine/ornithine permease
MGWIYWLSKAMYVGLEFVAAGLLMKRWFPNPLNIRISMDNTPAHYLSNFFGEGIFPAGMIGIFISMISVIYAFGFLNTFLY